MVVGVNRFASAGQKPLPTLNLDPQLEHAQVERLRRVRAERPQAAVQVALAALEGAAASSENLMPQILAAVEAYATLGEISDALRRVFGEYRETVVV